MAATVRPRVGLPSLPPVDTTDSATENPVVEVPTVSRGGGAAPFIIGVSGHRDLDERGTARLGAAITGLLRQIRGYLPDTEMRLVGGMARGADLLAARTALDLGLSVHAMLPLPLQHYAADFDPASLSELETLLARPKVRRVELSLVKEPEPRCGVSAGDRREEHYLNLTRTLISSCHLLLAMWDGKSSARPGGTADTVLRYLGARSDGKPQESPILFGDAPAEEDRDSPLVYWIPTARSGSSPSGQPATPCYLSSLGDDVLRRWARMPKRFRSQLIELNERNRNHRERTRTRR